MKIEVNNESREIPVDNSLVNLLKEMNLVPEKALISINGDIIDQEKFSNIILKENDSIDIFSFVGGG